MEALFTGQNLIALLTLLALEVVLGIDNVIFIAILSEKLPQEQRARARTTGIALAVGVRIALLFAIGLVMSLTAPLFAPFGNEISGQDVVLILGGLFLIGKSTYEIHEKLEAVEHTEVKVAQTVSFASVIIQILLVDMVFSIDSVLTAIGISGVMWVMVTAVLVAAGVMLFFAGAIAGFVEKHPTMKILALAFLILIGTLLVIEGWAPDAAHDLQLKNYAYFAMVFAFIIELINIRLRPKASPVHLHNRPELPAA